MSGTITTHDLIQEDWEYCTMPGGLSMWVTVEHSTYVKLTGTNADDPENTVSIWFTDLGMLSFSGTALCSWACV